MSDTQDWVKIVRDFDAPIETVWAMWTDPTQFASWYGPNGFSIPSAEMDVTVGGARKIAMQMPDGKTRMWFTGVYKEVSAPTRLVYTEAMCDADGNILSPADMGMPEGFPDITEVIVDLAEIDGKTRMTMVHKGIPASSPGEGGWMQAIDKMAALLG